jgi:hypothetical protein
MSRTLQFKRYNTATLANTIGANGELIINSTTHGLTVHDGSTAGGFSLATANDVTSSTTDAYARTTANTATNNITIMTGVNNTQNTSIFAAAQTVPQNAQSTNYVLQLTDAGKHIYYTQSSNATLYIPTTSNVAFSNGSTIMIVSRTSSSANITVSPNTGVTMYFAGNTTSASRNVTTYGMASLIQVASNTWFINGTGVS